MGLFIFSHPLLLHLDCKSKHLEKLGASFVMWRLNRALSSANPEILNSDEGGVLRTRTI